MPGLQTLNGEDALKFVRFREYVDADIGRIRAQQAFLQALADKVLRISTVTKLPSMISEMLPYVVTDMSNEDIMYLASVGLGVKLDEVKWAILPGEAGYIGDVSYYLVDTEKAAQVVDEIVRGIDREKNSESGWQCKMGAVFRRCRLCGFDLEELRFQRGKRWQRR